MPQLISDATTSYLYDDNGNPIEQIDTNGTALYYQHDQYGSTRLLTNQAGAIAATYTYNPYGALTTHTGTADTPLRWNGQYQDSDTGLYYLRARYYNPVTTQFLTRDPLEALTLAAYAYAAGDPLDLADPLGLWGWSETLGTIGAVAGIAAIVAAGPVAIAFGAVAIVAGAGATYLDIANGAPAWQVALDAVGVLPGAGALAFDVKAGAFAARSKLPARCANPNCRSVRRRR